MLRRILAPLSPPSSEADKDSLSESPAESSHPGAVYRREPFSPSLKDVTVSEPRNFKQLAHVECDPNTGLYTGMDEFLTLAVSSKGRRRSSLDQKSLASATQVDASADVLADFPQSDDLERAASARAQRRGPGGDDDVASMDDPVAKIQAAAVAAASSSRPTTPPPPPGLSKPPRAPSGVPGRLSPTKRLSPRRLGGVGGTATSASSKHLFAKPSMPTGVTHAVHVRVDPSHPTGFAGLPSAWESILLYSGIARDEALRHPQEVVDVLNFSKAQEGHPQDAAEQSGTQRYEQPQGRYAFPRTPTVTSFDDASDFSAGLNAASEASTPTQNRKSRRHSVVLQVPDLVLAPPEETEVVSSVPDTETRPEAAARDRRSGGFDEPSRASVASSLRNAAIKSSAVEGRERGPKLVRSMTNVDFRGGGLPASIGRKTFHRSPRSGMLTASSEKENVGHPRPLRPRSRSSAGGLAALAAKVAGDNDSDETDAAHSRTEEDMKKIIGIDRVKFRPDCHPADADMEIRLDGLHTLFSSITKVGEGSSGSVYSAVRRTDGLEFAIKQVKPANEKDWALYRYEVHVMMSHTDPENLVSCYDAFREGEHLFMVLELMTESLADVLERRRAGAFNRAISSPPVTHETEGLRDGSSRIESRKKSRPSTLAMATGFEEDFIAYVCREVLQGLSHVHGISRVHRDIKSDNILVRKDGAVKVADFGFCAELSAGARNTVVGTPYQMAPEVIRGKDYGTAVDIWSTGVLAYELAEGVPPHDGLAPIRAMFKIATSDPPALGEVWSQELRDFVAVCCSLDPTKRPSASEALRHSFLSRACSREEAGEVMFGE